MKNVAHVLLRDVLVNRVRLLSRSHPLNPIGLGPKCYLVTRAVGSRLRGQRGYFWTVNLCTVSSLYVSPERRIVEGNCGLFGESG